MHARTEGLLAQNLDSLVELGGQLTAAKVGAEVASCLHGVLSYVDAAS